MKCSLNLLYLCLILILSSCVREDIVKIKPQPDKEKLVVFGFLTPGKTTYIRVGKTQTFGNGSYNVDNFYVDDATVTISNTDGDKVPLQPVKESKGLYSVSQNVLSVKNGGIYELQVESPSLKTVNATTTVPLEKAVWRNVRVYPSEPSFLYELSGEWSSLNVLRDIDYGVAVINPSNEIKIMQYENEGIVPVGDEYTVKRDVFFSDNKSIQAVLITRDKNYSEFSKVAQLTTSVLNYYHNAVFADIISGFKGVIPQGSNIENGLGVFGSYLTDTKTLYKN